MEKNLFQQAKDAASQLMNMQGSGNKTDEQAVKSAIEAAYESASPDEQQHLEELEQQLEQKDQLS